jgi:hypothetical protein
MLSAKDCCDYLNMAVLGLHHHASKWRYTRPFVRNAYSKVEEAVGITARASSLSRRSTAAFIDHFSLLLAHAARLSRLRHL